VGVPSGWRTHGYSARRSRARPVLIASGFAAGFTVTYFIAVRTWQGQVVDSAAFRTLAPLHDAIGAAAAASRAFIPATEAVVVTAMIAIALFSRRWLDVGRATVIVAGSVVACEVLKALLPRPEMGSHGYQENTFPSGHVAFALSAALAVSVVSVHRPWTRVVFALSLTCALGLAWASIVTYAHRPSDVIGAALLVGVVDSLVLQERASVSRGKPALVVGLCLVGALAAVSVIAGSRIEDAFPAVRQLTVIETAGWLTACAVAIGFVVLAAPRAMRRRETGAHR